MSKRVAGSRRRPADEEILDGAMVVVALVPSERGLEVRLQNRDGVPEEDVIGAIEEAVHQMKGGHDRARGCW